MNIPTVTKSNISFGPARVFMGVAGATPTVDVGAIGEDGVSFEIMAEKKEIVQGNPAIAIMAFTQGQKVNVKFTGIEWNFDNLAMALGAGVTTSSGSAKTFSWGGDPLVTEIAIHIQHYMATGADTLNIYMWKAYGDGSVASAFSQDEHQFPMSFSALRASTDWGGTSLPDGSQLVKFERTL